MTGRFYFCNDFTKKYTTSRNGKNKKAGSKWPRNNCQVPKMTIERTNMIRSIAAGLLMNVQLLLRKGGYSASAILLQD
jgi:hypothetical protein